MKRVTQHQPAFVTHWAKMGPVKTRARNEPTKTSSQQIDILLVDDRPENLLALEAVLQHPNYRLIRANSGVEALRFLLDHSPAIILLDVQMPELDGFEVADYIKKSERSRDIPIIFITAINTDLQFVHQGYETGAIDYIFKPFDATILRSKVAAFADLYQKNQLIIRQKEELAETERITREREVAQLELLNLRHERIAQQKYRDLVDGIDHGIIWSADPDTLLFTFVSPSAERILGHSLEKWSSQPGFLIGTVHPDDRALVKEEIKKARIGEVQKSFEHRLLRVDGTTLWFQTGLKLAHRTEGPGFELRGFSTDITRLKEAGAALKQSERRARIVAESSLLISQSLDFESKTSPFGNLSLSEFTDWYAIDLYDPEKHALEVQFVAHRDPQKAALAKRLHDLYLKDPELEVGPAAVIKSGRSQVYAEVIPEVWTEELKRLGSSDNDVASVLALRLSSVIIAPLTARGKTLGAMTFALSESKRHFTVADLGMFEDLACRVAVGIDNSNLYKASQKAVKARDEFLSIASHELKTPLTPLKLQTQILMRALSKGTVAELGAAKIARIVESGNRQISRLSLLIDNLLDVSRINIGRLALTPEEFNLPDLVREVVERFSEQFKAINCSLELKIPDSLIVYWDRFRIEQVIVNLVNNAMKYGEGRPIQIELNDAQGSIHLMVRDHGMGINKADQERIFERFERAASALHFGGLGLGLYIVTQILEAHGGRISVQSEPGIGSTFTVELPARVSMRPSGKSESAA